MHNNQETEASIARPAELYKDWNIYHPHSTFNFHLEGHTDAWLPLNHLYSQHGDSSSCSCPLWSPRILGTSLWSKFQPYSHLLLASSLSSAPFTILLPPPALAAPYTVLPGQQDSTWLLQQLLMIRYPWPHQLPLSSHSIHPTNKHQLPACSYFYTLPEAEDSEVSKIEKFLP